MMRKKLRISCLAVLLSACSVQMLAQNSMINHDEDYEYRIGVDLFSKQKYSQAQYYFERVVAHYGDAFSDIKADAQYYAALCALELFNNDAEYRIHDFIERYPESPRTRVAYFEMGRYQYRVQRYQEAVDYFDKVWKQNLNQDQLCELYFKKGYSYFKLEQYDKASKMFYELLNKESIYTAPATYYYAHIAYMNKNYETALNNLKKLEDDQTFSPLVPYYRAQIYFIQGKDDQVIKLGKEILEMGEGKRQAEMSRIVGEALYNKELYAEALPYMETYKEKAETYTREDIYQLGYVYYQTADYEKVVSTMSNVTNVDDALSQNAFFHIAQSYMQLGNKESAMKGFESAAKYKYNDKIREQSLLNYAKLSYELSYSPFNQTIKAFNQYLELYPNSIHHDDAYEYLTKVYLSSKNYEAALQSLNNIKNKTPEMQAAWQRVAYFRGLELFNNLRFEESIEAFDRAIELKSFDRKIRAYSQYWKGEALYRLERYAEAIEAYNGFLVTPGAYSMPEYNTCYYNMGYCYFKQHNYATASDWFRKFVDKSNDVQKLKLADGYIRMADCMFMTSNYVEAVKYYDNAVKLDTFDVEYALFQKGFSMGLSKNQLGKIEALSKLLATNPNSTYAADALFERGRSYMIIDSADFAIKDFDNIVDNYSNSSYVIKSMLQLGLIHYAEGRNQNAIEYFKAVIDKYPGTSESREAMSSLKNIYVDMNQVDDYFAYAQGRAGGADVNMEERDSLVYMSAEKVYMSGNWERANDLFTKYLTEYPTGKFTLNAHFYRGDCAFKQEQDSLAKQDFLYVVEKPKNIFSEAALLSAATLAEKQKDYKQAYSLYEKLKDNAEIKSNLIVAREGMMDMAYADSNFNNAVEAGREVIMTDKVTEEQVRKARRIMAISYKKMNQLDPARTQFAVLATDMNSFEGAEAQYCIAQMQFEQQDFESAEKEANELIMSGTPHLYWVAKAFFMLADICANRGDNFQAKANLQSVIDNYDDQSDGILDEANEKLKSIVDKENVQFGQSQSQETEVVAPVSNEE
ncbi:MAG: tetratricopeptide repeat protein [Salinivirgaceae bacterium]|nr:tetratricopeptide repeat protein [Salinivirgaceae bacterium]